MALTWDCQPRFLNLTVPPQDHYSINQVGVSLPHLTASTRPA
jgi:hypothetical protein